MATLKFIRLWIFLVSLISLQFAIFHHLVLAESLQPTQSRFMSEMSWSARSARSLNDALI